MAHVQQVLITYLKQEFAGILGAVKESDPPYFVATSFAHSLSVEIHRMPQDGKQRVNADSPRNQHEVSRGFCRLGVKAELSTYSQGHFRAEHTLGQGRRMLTLVLLAQAFEHHVP